MLLIVFICFLLIFFIHTYFVLRGSWKNIDTKFYNSIKINDFVTKVLVIITSFASSIYFIILSCFLLILIDNKKIVFTIIMGLIIDSCIVYTVKHIIKRKRPNIKRLIYEKGYSYISGHSFTSTFFYGLVAVLVILSNISITLKIGLCISLILFVLTIFYSRIYLGVHYLSDTVGGFLLGSSYLAIFVYFSHIILKVF